MPRSVRRPSRSHPRSNDSLIAWTSRARWRRSGGCWGRPISISTKRPRGRRIETKVGVAPGPGRSAAAPAATSTGGRGTVSTISIDEFRKLDIRVGEVVSATRVPGTEKLIEVKVDIGGEVRTLVTGLVPQYQPEELIGKRIIVLANLEPRRVRGVTSQGMLLAAEWEGEGALLTVG